MKAADLPLTYNAVDILERNLAERGDRVALRCGDRTSTFAEMSAEVNRVGNALLALGVRRDETIALLCPDRAEWVASYFGTIKIGAVVASLNTLLTPREYEYMLNDCRASVVIVHASLSSKIADIRHNTPSVGHVVVIGDETPEDTLSYAAWITAQSPELEAATTHRDDVCCLNYSSGTTGEPKGILHAHKDLPLTAELVGVGLYGLTPDDITFAVAKLFFTFGTGGNLVFPWYAGASIVLFEGSPRVAKDVLAVIDRYKPTVFYTAPTSYASMLAIPDFATTYDLSSLRMCMSAGEALPAPIWHAWKEATGLEAIDGIGSTENYHMFVANHPGDVRPGSTGKPIAGYEVRIVDPNGDDVPQGELGSLWVKGETSALSYLHQYERSKKSFRGEWLDTGDKYYVDADGYYWHAGRTDDMLKVGGIWVSPVEVESALISHDSVLECAVVGRADPSGLIKPKAYVVCAPGATAGDELEAALIEHCKAEMAAYKRPRWIEFRDELPKTATGKIQRFRLRD